MMTHDGLGLPLDAQTATEPTPPASTSRGAVWRRFQEAEALLERFAEEMDDTPPQDRTLWPDYFRFTGAHMILTDEGWEPGEMLATYRAEYADFEPEAEVNAPLRRYVVRHPEGGLLGNEQGARWTRDRAEADEAASMCGGTVEEVSPDGRIIPEAA